MEEDSETRLDRGQEKWIGGAIIRDKYYIKDPWLKLYILER